MGNERNSRTLRARLALKQRELDLILTIDRIRDTVEEPPAMLAAVVGALTNQLRADLGLLCLVNRETGELELKAINDSFGLLGQLIPAKVRELARRVSEADDIVVLEGVGIPPSPDSLPPFLAENSPVAIHSAPSEDFVGTMQLAGIRILLADRPYSQNGRPLGALLLARFRAPFEHDDVALLKTAETQIDSAVRQASLSYELKQRNLELETIHRVDRIRDQSLPFDDMLKAVLQELCAVMRVEMGFIMLYNRVCRRLELRASTHEQLFQVAPYCDIVDQTSNEALHQAGLVCHNDLGDMPYSVMCIPLILHDEIIGVLGVASPNGPRGFDAGDCRLLSAIASQMDTAIFESLERVWLRQVLGRSVDPRVMERLLANPEVDFLKGERSVLSVLYADIRGSTSLAERIDPESLVGFINHYLSRMTEVILAHEGTLDKFVGDEVMALFGAPFPQPDHALRAVRVGLEMQTVHQALMESWRAQGVEAAPIGIGIATGELTVGEMGSAQRSDYTVIGRAANLGARICSAARAGQVLICQATYDLVKGRVEAVSVGGLNLKGIAGDVTVYQVKRILD